MNTVTLRQTRVALVALLALLTLCAFELLAPGARPVWLLVGLAGIGGAYLRPVAAAAAGWLLVLALATYLIVHTALGLGGGADWLTLLIIPWVPMLTSNVIERVRVAEGQIVRQLRLLEQQVELHPLTELPGLGLAGQFLPTIQASHRRQHHHTALVEVRLVNLTLLRTLYPPEEVHRTLLAVRDTLLGALRGSDWLFHVAEDRLLVVADVGQHPGGEQVLATRLTERLQVVGRLEADLRVLLDPTPQPLTALLETLQAQPVHAPALA